MSESTETQSASENTDTVSTEATTVNTEGETQNTTSYLDGKYESVSALESGYRELQSTFSTKTAEYSKAVQGKTGAPEAYEFAEGISVSEGMEAYAREQGYSNEALNDLATAYQNDINQANDAYIAEQKEALGKDADTRIQNVIDWGRANLGEEAIDTLNAMVTTAAGVEIFEKISKISQGTSAAVVESPRTVVDRDTVKAMRFAKDEFGSRRMSSDPQYRAKVEAMEAEFITSGGKLN